MLGISEIGLIITERVTFCSMKKDMYEMMCKYMQQVLVRKEYMTWIKSNRRKKKMFPILIMNFRKP
ncbi:hypothetical protein OIQ_03965 [Enterococcus faecium EnGen0025]|nr:hypothetical protein OIQ_03965 [Enterococcus faecium EnGen0025]